MDVSKGRPRARLRRVAVRRRVVRVRHAEFARLVVHPEDERLEVARLDRTPGVGGRGMLGEEDGGVVRAPNHDGHEEVVHGHRLAGLEPDAARPLLAAAHTRRHARRRVVLECVHVLQAQEERHQLRHGGRARHGVGVPLEEDLARLGVHRDRAHVGRAAERRLGKRRRPLRRRAPRGHLSLRRRRAHRRHARKGHRTEEDCIIHSPNP